MLLNIFMKKVFIQLWHWILKNKKELIYGVLALFVSQICFFGIWWIGVGSEVFAQNNDNATQSLSFEQQATEWYWLMSFAQKLVYVLIYPVLIVAGKLIDNSLVYWEVFWFDAILWKLWVIVRNLANFGLWFIFIYKIFEFLIKGQKWEEIKKLLVSTLIAWIWIQASWFVMAALIDLSTILTYWVWWLPISVLWWDNSNSSGEEGKKKEDYNPYILKTVVSVDAKDMDSMHVYMTNTDKDMDWNVIKDDEKKYISECATMNLKINSWYSEELIIAPKMIYYKDMNWKYFETEFDACNYFGQIYNFMPDMSDHSMVFFGWSCDNEEDCSFYQSDHNDSIAIRQRDIMDKWLDWVRWEIEKWTILLPWNAHETGGIISNIRTWIYTNDAIWLDVDNKAVVADGMKTSKLNNLIDWESYVWVFTALYSSLLNAWRGIMSTTDASTYALLLNAILSLCHMLAIAIPLIVVALVFMMRIGVLWMAIALSPMIILLKAFSFDKSDFMKKGVFKYLSVENLLPIIFYPAVICFAVSMSTVLVRIISDLNMGTIDTLKDEILWWIIKLNIQWFSIGVWKLVMSVLWIAITWFLVWAAVECSELWKTNMVKSLKWIATDAILSAKVVPIPTKNWTAMVWLGTVFGHDGNWWILSRMSDEVKSTFSWEENEALQQMFDKDSSKKAAETRFETYKTKLLSSNWVNRQALPIDVWEEWSKKVSMSFDKLEDEASKKKIIDAINGLKDDERSKFGGADVVIWGQKYHFYPTYNKTVDWKMEAVALNKWMTETEYEQLK